MPADGATPGEAIRRHSKSFSLACRLLPAQTRPDVERLYAWCRWCDDGVDAAASPRAADAFIHLATRDLRRLATGREPHAVESRWLGEVMQRRPLSIEAADALLTGMRFDLTPASGLDEQSLLRYCFRAAGSVGVLMCPVLGMTDRRYTPHAAALGIGMQLTNIARDVAEDWSRGRCYLPLEWTGGLRPGGDEPEERGVRDGVRRVLDLADDFYAAGEAGLAALGRRPRVAVRAASRFYHAIGAKIRRADYRVLAGRTRVSLAEKLGLLAAMPFASASHQRPGRHAGNALRTAEGLLQEHGVTL
ncbi:MAG: phytoene/squalene synthase family protein [Planctomycetota bacterium]